MFNALADAVGVLASSWVRCHSGLVRGLGETPAALVRFPVRLQVGGWVLEAAGKAVSVDGGWVVEGLLKPPGSRCSRLFSCTGTVRFADAHGEAAEG